MENFQLFHPVPSDAKEITGMIIQCDISDHGVPDITLSDLLHMWNTIDITCNAWTARSQEDKIAGYAFLDVRGEDRMDTCVFVHPEFKNQGIGSKLLTMVEERARMLSIKKGVPQQLMNHIPFTNGAARKIVESRGYEFSRLYQRMKIELQGPITESLLQGEIKICPFRPGQDEEVLYEMYDETFRDSWGYSKKDADEWIRQQKGEEYDPSLWFLVWDQNEPVGFLMSRMQDDGLFIDYLGVRRKWRRLGVGLALLQHAFQTSWQRGQNTVLLYVDTDSLTNAHRLYNQAGMSPDLQTALYRKII